MVPAQVETSAHIEESVWADVAARASGGLGFAGSVDVEWATDRIGAQLPAVSNPFARLRGALQVSPGTIAWQWRSSKALGDDEEEPRGWVQGQLFTRVQDDEAASPKVRGAVSEWSSRSRARMVRKIAELDFGEWMDGPGMLAMVTLTLPGCWADVAPTGRAFKRMVGKFRDAWRAAGLAVVGIWKLEFQGRGAPHLHALMKVPAMVSVRGKDVRFEHWLSRMWADIVRAAVPAGMRAEYERDHYRKHLAAGTGVDFSGVKFSDPRRTAVYFLKHSAKTRDNKEYQHLVPQEWQGEGRGPGRFWGVWGLSSAVGEVPVTWAEFVAVRRVARHVAIARASRVAQGRARRQGLDPLAVKGRTSRLLGRRQVGFLVVNDGVGLALDVGRFLADRTDPRADPLDHGPYVRDRRRTSLGQARLDQLHHRAGGQDRGDVGTPGAGVVPDAREHDV